MGRAGESVMSELAGFAGTLQAEGFSGYNQIYKGGAIREAACVAHLRRKIFDVHDSQPTELSTTAMAGIQAIYRRRDTRAPARRAIGRTTKAIQATGPRAATTAHAPGQRFLASCRYRQGLRLWHQAMARFNRFLYDGQLKPDNLIAERAIRGFTVGRRNWLFSGSFAAAGARRSCSAS
ncbi:IS66 family transposase [Mesorhizobium sp. M1338]